MKKGTPQSCRCPTKLGFGTGVDPGVAYIGSSRSSFKVRCAFAVPSVEAS